MAYQALYRKWRPATFDDVRGQDAIVKTLKNQIKNGRIGHAYLFCGTRGTGKTSVAKIFARAVNCAHTEEHDGSPCNACSVCKNILVGNSLNVFEIDAASNNGVENIRNIREQVEYPPTEGRYKVYIIDEVHMLSTGAFNALLKTLEEPPAYVIFILATTDPQKVPQTILSRCQRYDFKRMSTDTVAARIHELMEAEHLDIEERAVRCIARAADGAMRDGLSLLEQCLAYHYGEKLTYQNVLDILGTADTAVFSALFRALSKFDVEEALRLAAEAVNAGKEIGQFVTDFIWYLRNVLLAKSAEDTDDLIDLSEENREALKKDAEMADRTKLLRMMYALSELSNRMRFAAQKRILLEVELIRLCTGVLPDAQAMPAQHAGAGSMSRQESTAVSARAGMNGGAAVSAQAARISSAAAALLKNAQEKAEPEAAAAGSETEEISAEQALSTVRADWAKLTAELMPSNRAVFSGVVLRAERGRIVVIFRNTINYKIAAMNREENGLLRLKELCAARYGMTIPFAARIAGPGEFPEEADRATDEELSRINFPIDIEG